MLKYLRLAAFGLAFVVTGPLTISQSWAGKFKAVELSGDQLTSVKRINSYINSFETLRGDFTQISPRGQASRGVIMISKPGKVRFEYAPPVPLLIVSDGKWLTIKNTKKESGDQFPLSATPLRLVVSSRVNLLDETDVIGFEQGDGVTSVTLQDKKGKLGGYIILVYDETAGVLQQWIVVDGKGKRTTVQLANLETGVALDSKLFKIKIDRDKNKRDSK
jgi:outer membrane lipoprotein-sorting protein